MNNQDFYNLFQKDAFLRIKLNTSFYNYVKKYNLNKLESAKLTYIYKNKLQYLIIEKQNLQYSNCHKSLPINKIIDEENNDFFIVKLNWN